MGHRIVETFEQEGGYISFTTDDGQRWLVRVGDAIECVPQQLTVEAVSHTAIQVVNHDEGKQYMVPVSWGKDAPVTKTYGPHPDKVITDEPTGPPRCDIVIENMGDNTTVWPGRVWINDVEVSGVYKVETTAKPQQPVEMLMTLYPTSITVGNPYVGEHEDGETIAPVTEDNRLNMGAMKRGRRPKKVSKEMPEQ